MEYGEKLNYRQTILVGFAFFSICAFWQLYNSVVPLILTNTFEFDETISGTLMAADNVLALFLLPFFGMLSDKHKGRLGRRRFFIIMGTIMAVTLMNFIPVIENAYRESGERGFVVAFIVVLGLLLVAMGTYRSPAVALMPDITPKPLRSKANAVINLMGAVGGISYLVIASLLYSGGSKNEEANYLPLFMIVAGIMLVSLFVVVFFVDEVKLHKKLEEYEAAHPEQMLTTVDESGSEVMPAEVKRSLKFLLLSISFWFIGYNGAETWFTTFANRNWGMPLGGAAFCLTLATGGAILSYIPSGILAGKIGRKKTIMTGVVLLSSCFMTFFIYSLSNNHFNPLLYGVFFAMGVAWACINVNSLPMVLEMCKGSDIGKFTGYYYTFSMAAQIVTPIVAGHLMKNMGYITLFPYAAIFTGLSFVTMVMVKHGDSKADVKRGLEAFDVED